MRLKLDENLGSRGVEILRAAGHDVATVAEQDLTRGLQTLAQGLKQGELQGKLWIVQAGRIREYMPEDEPGGS